MEIQEPVENSYWDWKKGKVDYVDEWFLMGSPIKILLILGAYLLFVLKLGPLYMKGRPAYKLRNVLLAYNIFQVGLSLYLFWNGVSGMMEHGMVEKETCYFNENKKELVYRLLSAHHLYFLAKMTELLDTIFFVLRKKWNQISLLHIYHHSFMFAVPWAALKYAPSFTFAFLGTINSFVHVVMYTYYGLSAFPQLGKYLWWKRHITKLQLIQFLVVLIQIQYSSIVTTCPISYFVLSVCWFNLLLFIYLFMDFYIKNYLKKRRQTQVTVDVKKET